MMNGKRTYCTGHEHTEQAGGDPLVRQAQVRAPVWSAAPGRANLALGPHALGRRCAGERSYGGAVQDQLQPGPAPEPVLGRERQPAKLERLHPDLFCPVVAAVPVPIVSGRLAP